MKDDLFALVEAAAALNAATDGMESLRPQRQAVLDALSNLSRRAEPVADEPVAWMYHKAGGSPYIRDIPPEEAKWQFGVTPLYEHPPAVSDEVLVERAAWSIIDGSAGERAANHAREFCTANWSDALRSARAILPIIRECLK